MKTLAALICFTIFPVFRAASGGEVIYLNDVIAKAPPEETKDLAKLLKQLSFVPSHKDPTTGGQLFKVTMVEKGSLYDRSGIKVGDFISNGSAKSEPLKLKSKLKFTDTPKTAGCQMRELDPKAKNKEKDIEVGKFRVHFFGAMEDGNTIFESASVYRGKKKICDIDGGIFDDVYSVGNETQVILKEYNGSCASHRLFDVEKCNTVGEPAMHCGVISLSAQQLISNPPCSDDVCSRGLVWDIDAKTCHFKFNEKASAELNKKLLGVDIPMNGLYQVLHKGTSKARLVPEN